MKHRSVSKVRFSEIEVEIIVFVPRSLATTTSCPRLAVGKINVSHSNEFETMVQSGKPFAINELPCHLVQESVGFGHILVGTFMPEEEQRKYISHLKRRGFEFYEGTCKRFSIKV